MIQDTGFHEEITLAGSGRDSPTLLGCQCGCVCSCTCPEDTVDGGFDNADDTSSRGGGKACSYDKNVA